MACLSLAELVQAFRAKKVLGSILSCKVSLGHYLLGEVGELAGEAGVEPELSTEDAFMIWWPMASPRGLDLSLLPFTGAASGTKESSKSIYLVKNNKSSVKTESYVLISPKELLLFPS